MSYYVWILGLKKYKMIYTDLYFLWFYTIVWAFYMLFLLLYDPLVKHFQDVYDWSGVYIVTELEDHITYFVLINAT